MDVSYLKMWLKSLIKEEINKDQLRSTAAALNKSEEYLRHWVERTDPTPNQGFGVWLLRGLKKQWIRIEDGPRAKQALERFILLRRQNRIADIMQFPQINDLEDEIARVQGDTEQGKKIAGIDPLSLPGVSILEARPQKGMVFYKVQNAKSLSKIGEGTKWCTRYSFNDSVNVAQNYINQYGYLVVGFKDGQPFLQFNPDYSQVMDVNDVNFRYNKKVNPKDLELPKPAFLQKGLPKLPDKPAKIKMIRPVEPKRSDTETLTPQQRQLANWMPFTHQTDPAWIDFIKPRVSSRARTMSTSGRDLDYERRLASSILKTKNHEFFSRMLGGFWDYASKELGPGIRSEIVEKALVEKNLDDIKQSFGLVHKGAKRPGGLRYKIREKRGGINGLHYIASYVANNIQGHWPEFERKLDNDPQNAIPYYRWARLNPDGVTNPLLKDVILFSKMMEEGSPTVPTKEFNATLRDFFARTRSAWKHGNFSAVISGVLEPFLMKTNQSVQDALGDKLAQEVARSFMVGRGTDYWKRKPNRRPDIADDDENDD